MFNQLLFVSAAALAWILPAQGKPPESPLRLTPVQLETGSGGSRPAERGVLTVPERHDRKGGREIELAFVRVRCTAKTPGPPIFFLAGGPGSSGIELVRDLVKQAPWALELGDVVGIDQRGVGASRPLLRTDVGWRAPDDVPGSRAAWRAGMAEAVRKVMAWCRARGIDPGAYNSIESAHDVDALRSALGYERIAIWGGSYGSHLRLAVLRYHGDHIARAVLTAPEGPDHTLKLPSQVQATLERLQALAHHDEAVRKRVPDLVAMLREVLAELDRKPRRVDIGGGREIVVGSYDVQVLLSGLMGRSRSLRMVPRIVADLHAGEFRQLAQQAARMRTMESLDAMKICMDLASGASAARRAQIEAEESWCVLGDGINFPLNLMLDAAPGLDCGDAYRGPLDCEVPVLFVAADLDCRTPIRNARELLARMPKGRLLCVENRGHDLPWGKVAVREQLVRFLRGEALTTSRITLETISLIPPR